MKGLMTNADEARALDLKIGDTIEGREECGSYWNITRLTLLWLGEREAVWRATSKSNSRPEWSEPCEASNWTLSARDWKRLPPKDTE